MKMKLNITFDTFSFRRPFIAATIQQCVEAVLAEEKVNVPCEINVLVTNDMGIQAINLASRNLDKPTDVRSFPMFEFTPGELPDAWEEYLDPESVLCPLGVMAISLERAISQAKELGHSVRREVGYLTKHSMLHLLGYDHMEDGPQKAAMRSKEELIASGISRMSR